MGISLQSLLVRMGAPPLLNDAFMNNFAEESLLSPKPAFPPLHLARARKDKHGRQMPQCIAHRGYKAQFPENTMGAFKGAVQVGAHGLETDVHLTKDGVVVLSHDATLKRCFGVDRRILDCDWKYVSELRTLKEPHQAMPRLSELLEYLAEPGMEKIWLLLDIKVDNNANDIMRLMAKEMEQVSPPDGTLWKDRIVLGFWAAKYVPLCEDYFPDFPLVNIGFSVPYCRQFLPIENVGFNVLQASLVSPCGRRLIRDAKAQDRQVISWTVNDVKNMDWCIRKKLDGVITDDPKKFLEVCEEYDEQLPPPAWSWKILLNFLRINFFVWIFGILFWRKHGFGIDKRYLRQTVR